jgi:hypothetical protein
VCGNAAKALALEDKKLVQNAEADSISLPSKQQTPQEIQGTNRTE